MASTVMKIEQLAAAAAGILAKDPLRENIMNGDRAYRTFLWIGNEK